MHTPHDATATPKVLRIAVFQGGQILDERLVRSGSVTVGHGPRNTLVLPIGTAPRSLKLFEHLKGRFLLQPGAPLTGKVTLQGRDVELAGATETLTLDESAKGRIVIGEATLLFQFVTPPAKAPGPSPEELKKLKVRSAVDHAFVGTLMVVLTVNFGFTSLLSTRERVVEEPIFEEVIRDRFGTHIFLPPKVVTPPPSTVKSAGPSRPLVAPAPSAGPVKGVTGVPSRATLISAVRGKGILGAIHSLDGPGSALNVLSTGSSEGDIQAALDGARSSSDTASTDAPSLRKGPESGDTTTIGRIGTDGGAKEKGVIAERHTPLGIPGGGGVTPDSPTVDPVSGSACDSRAISAVVRRNLGGIQGCYDRAMKRELTLSGRLIVRFVISESGSVGETEIEETSIRSDLMLNCVRATISAWRFPKSKSECAVAHPFVFTPPQ